MKEKLKYILIFMLLIVPFIIMLPVRADSGWDTDYDSSGSDWSSSDSDWDTGWSSSDSNWHTRSNYSGSGGDFLLTFILFTIILIIIFIVANSKTHTTSKIIYASLKEDISEDEITKILPDETLDSLKEMAYNKFLDIQNAWMEFDYDKLRELCTDELYNSYISQLDTLKLKNGKNIMTEFIKEEIKVTGIKEENNIVTVTIYLRVTFYDYVVDTNTFEAIRGSKERKVTNNYKMKFVRKTNNSKKEITCPNCGAPIKLTTSKKCPYCDSTIVVDANDFVLSKKTNINK